MSKQSDRRRWGRLEKYGINAEEYKREIESGFLWCCSCKQFLISDKFSDSEIARKFGTKCKECARALSRKWQSEHSEHHKARMREYYKKNAQDLREYQRKRRAGWTAEHRSYIAFRNRLKGRFGISQAQYQQMLESQNNGCAICQRPQNGRRLAIDHDHACCPRRITCGKCLRGLLCERCNALIGFLEKNRELLPRCESYMKQRIDHA